MKKISLEDLSGFTTDQLYMRLAYEEAKKSPDDSTKNGAIIVRNNSIYDTSNENIIGKGINDFPSGIKPTAKLLKTPTKYGWIGHAERHAIYDAAKRGNSTNEAIMYCPWFACSPCGDAISNSGIGEVIGYTGPEKWAKAKSPKNKDAKEWEDSIAIALKIFDEKNIKYKWIDGPLFYPTENFQIPFRGNLVNP